MSARFDPDTASREQLIARVDLLQGQVEALSGAFTRDRLTKVCSTFGVTQPLARLLVVLADGQSHTKAGIFDALFWDRPNDEPEFKIVDVYVCKLRKKFAGTGIEIHTIWGTGYRIGAGVDILNAAIEAEQAPPRLVDGAPSIIAEGRTQRGHGAVRDAALETLHAIADAQGIARVNTGTLCTGFGTQGSVLIRNLERGGYLKVLSRPRMGGRGDREPWRVQLTGAMP